MLLRRLIGLFLDWVRRNRSPATHSYYRFQLRKIPLKVLSKKAGQVKPAEMFGRSWSSHCVAACKRLFNWAFHTADLVSTNPLAGVRTPRRRGRKRTLSRREALLLLRAAGRDFREFLLAMRETGARPQEIRALWWNDLHGTEGLGDGRAFFCLADHKGRQLGHDGSGPRIIPVSPRLGRLLHRLKQRGSSEGEIFLTTRGRPWTKDALVNRVRRLRVKLTWLRERFGERIVCYTIRHTTATSWAAAGVNGHLLGELLGHKSTETTARYLHLSPEALQGALRAFWRARGRRE
jgi:integrase